MTSTRLPYVSTTLLNAVWNQATSFVPAGIGIASMHGRPAAETSVQVTVRTRPNGTTCPSMWFCTSGWLKVGNAVDLPSS